MYADVYVVVTCSCRYVVVVGVGYVVVVVAVVVFVIHYDVLPALLSVVMLAYYVCSYVGDVVAIMCVSDHASIVGYVDVYVVVGDGVCVFLRLYMNKYCFIHAEYVYI